MKKLGTPMVALTAAAAMLVTGCAEANNRTRSSEQGQHRKARVADVTNSQQQQASMHPEADDDFGDADAYYNLHPEGGK